MKTFLIIRIILLYMSLTLQHLSPKDPTIVNDSAPVILQKDPANLKVQNKPSVKNSPVPIPSKASATELKAAITVSASTEDPYAIPDLADEAANAAKKVAEKAAADAAEKAALIDPANPDLPAQWKVIPGRMASIAMSGDSNNPILVGLDAGGKPFKLEANRKIWSPLPTRGNETELVAHRETGLMKIVRAVYGGGNGQREIRDVVQEFVRGNVLEMNVNNDALRCDPSPGKRKWLFINWECNGASGTGGADEYDSFKIEGPMAPDSYTSKSKGSQRDLIFKDLKVASDGSMAAIATDETIWTLQDTLWTQVVGQAESTSIGSANELWVINKNKDIFRKKNPIHYHGSWYQSQIKGISIASSGDGSIFLAGSDQKIYQFNRKTKQFDFVVKPADIGINNPLKIAATPFNLVFLDYQKQLWKLLPGMPANDKNSWINISETLQVKDFCIGHDGSIIIIDVKDRIIQRTPTKEEQKDLDIARGEIVYAGQVTSFNVNANINFGPAWTHAWSALDANGNNQPPNNHQEVCVAEASDFDAYSGSFFMITKKDNETNNDPINFNDEVNIWSLYSLGSNAKKAGALSKDWKWWTNGIPNTRNDILVSLSTCPQTKNGQEGYKLVSPIGKSGPIRSNDTVEIVSTFADTKDRRVVSLNWSDSRRNFYQNLGVPTGNWSDENGFKNSIYGEETLAGAQFFKIKAINKIIDIPDYNVSSGKTKAREVFSKISGNFFKVAPDQTKVDKDSLVNNHNDGIGVFKEIRNYTEFNLDAAEIGTVKPQDTKQGLNRDLITNLTIKGFSKESEIKDFGPAKMIQLDKLWSKGVAWITESLETPEKATISFLARSGDQGNIQVAFNNSLQPDAKWRVIIGGWNNSKARILRGNQIMAEADAKTTQLAQAAPGRFTPYWVSINNGFIMVGVGSPGENIFMSCFIPDPETIDRYGFSSHDGNVDYTEVSKSGALQAWADENIYQANEPNLTLPAKPKSITWLKSQLRVPNEGTISFNAQAQHSVTLVLQNAKKENYKVVIGANKNKELRILKGDGKPALQIFTGQTGQGKLFANKKTNFWVSIQGGRFIVGQGNAGENTFGVWEDQLPLTEIVNVGFETTDHQQKISDFKFSPPVTIGTEEKKSTYDQIVDRFPYKGSVLLIRYFEFQFAQDGQYISAKDMVTGQNFHIFPTPQQGARYILKLDIQVDGTPSVTQLEGPHEDPAKMELNRQAALADIDAAKLKDQADGVLRAGKSLGEGWSGGSGAGSIIASAGSLIFAGVGAGVSAAGSQAAADASKKRLEAQLGYRADDSPVFTEAVNRAAGLKPGDIPDTAIEHRKMLTTLLNQARFLSFNKKADYSKLLAIYISAMNYISHAYTIEDTAIKQSIYDALDQFQDAYKIHPDQYSSVITLFVKAFSNNYLTNSNNEDESRRRDRWYSAMLEICSNLFEQSFTKNNFEIDIAALRGEYLWVPRQFIDGTGSVTFEAKGQNDVFVCFAQQDYKVKDPINKIYEFDFGAWKNTTIEARIRSLGKPAVKFSATNDPESRNRMLNPNRFQTYWINFGNGHIQVGLGKIVGKNVILNWQDPFPWKDIKYIGFGSWNVPVTIRNIKLTNVKVVTSSVDEEEIEEDETTEQDSQPEEVTPTDPVEAEEKLLADDEKIEEEEEEEEEDKNGNEQQIQEGAEVEVEA